MNIMDGLHVVEFYQNPDSFGWSICAIFYADYRFSGPKRWGTIDALANTEHGADDPEPRLDMDTEGKRDCVRRLWHLVDWHKDEETAKAAFQELKERLW